MIKQTEIIEYLRLNIVPHADAYSKKAYRASVYLNDNTYLPCVIFRNKNDILDLALKRFDELRDTNYFKDVVESFIISGSTVPFYDLRKIEESPYAIPSHLREIISSAGETKMGYISFLAEMHDGKKFYFESTSYIEFFDMPEGYDAKMMINVTPHKYTAKEEYREKPFFNCYIENL